MWAIHHRRAPQRTLEIAETTMAELSLSSTPPEDIPRETRSRLLHFHNHQIAEIKEYSYTRLPHDVKRIRLLRLFPGVLESSLVLCEMFEYEFPEEGEIPERVPYEALSWRWGDEKNTPFTIMIRKAGEMYKKKVSQTLGLALKYLRGQKDRILWIDAICINQDDKEERSYQVSMMSLVYTRAQQVCVWLGEDDADSREAIRFIREEISHLKDFDKLCADQKHAPKWRAFLSLMQRDWFSRRWVVQEIALAPKATVYCGPDRIEWRELAIAVELFVEVETATHRLSELLRKDDKSRLVPNWFEHISELGASLLVNATARIFREYQRGGVRSDHGPARRSLLSLEYLVTSLSIFDCGRPHDSVYALIAIARDASPNPPTSVTQKRKGALIAEVFSEQLEQKPYPLDYNTPYPDVCKEFIQFCIERCAKLDPIQALDVLCRPWAKDWHPGEFAVVEDAKPQPEQPNRHDWKPRQEPWKVRCSDRATDFFQRMMMENKFQQKLPATEQTPSGTNQEEPNSTSHDGETPESVETNPVMDEVYEDDRDISEYLEQSLQEWPVRDMLLLAFPGGEAKTNKSTSARTSSSKTQVDEDSERGPNGTNQVVHPNEDPTYQEILSSAAIELGLPSWVARIDGAPFDIFPHPGMDMVKMGRKNADPLVGTPQDGHRNYSAGQSKVVDLEILRFRRRPRLNHYSLYVKGFCFDRVEKVAQISQAGAIPASWLDLAGWSKARRKPTQTSEDIEDPPDAFWRTLVADRGRNDRNPPYYYARACKETIMKGGIRSNAVDTTALIFNERNSIIAEFCRRVQAVIWNRALIKTKRGALGLVSEDVKEGDLVCIIYGCTVPVILRQGSGKFKTSNEQENERLEDGIEAMKRLMTRLEKNRIRKAEYLKQRKSKRRKIRKATERYNQDLLTRQSSKREYNEEKAREEKARKERAREEKAPETHERRMEWAGEEDKLSEDVTDLEGSSDEIDAEDKEIVPDIEVNGQSESGSDSDDDESDHDTEDKEDEKLSKQMERQRKADIRDAMRHFKFLGEAYIHGMMDGEAVRQKFERDKPDHVFEIR